ncbi:[Pyruvate dehydrogenase (acetyl-transferring)] kinase 2, mitochondrial, partial [Coemansia sp. RSA 2706]
MLLVRHAARARGPGAVTRRYSAKASPLPKHAGIQTAGRSLQQKFYENRILDRYTAQEPKKVSLRQLVLFGRQLTEDKLLASANYVRTELP